MGNLPGAWSEAGLTARPRFVDVLTDCGFTVATDDPGPGTVLCFDADGGAMVLVQGAREPAD
jgi:hypothetical protein